MRNEEYFAERYFIFNVSLRICTKIHHKQLHIGEFVLFVKFLIILLLAIFWTYFFLKLHIANNFFEQLTIFQTYIFCAVIFGYLDFRAGLGALISLLLCASWTYVSKSRDPEIKAVHIVLEPTLARPSWVYNLFFSYLDLFKIFYIFLPGIV